MTHASLFSGIGGPEVAAAMLGWDNAFHCEINPFGRAVLEYWFPNSISYEDITKTDFKPWRGRIDVLTGGFPCQPFSYAGQRRGQDDDRYLWPQMLRAIDEIRPAWVVGENVAGITTMVEGGVLADLGGSPTLFQEGDELHGYELEQSFTIERICRDLEQHGYSVQPMLIPAAAVGAPHRRDRIFILAYDADPHRSNDAGSPGGYAGACREERVQERDEVRESGIADNLRPALQESAAYPASDGRHGDTREDGEKRCAGADGKRASAQGSNGVGLRRESGIYGQQLAAADTDGCGCEPQDAGGRAAGNRCHDALPSQRGLQAERADGFPPVQRDASDTASRGSGTLSEQVPAGVADGDRPLRDGRVRDATNAERTGLQGQDQPRPDQGGERVRVRGDFAGHDRPDLLPGNRWADFPLVSPVHRGNDGIPFDVDGLTIPFAKWRTESLKAYGNAIVPQVMYQIFKSIELCQTNQ